MPPSLSTSSSFLLDVNAILLPRQASPQTTSTPTPDPGNWRAYATDEDFVLESWSQGFMVGALIIMACITIANMRRGVLLHKLILLEQLLAMSHGTFCFMSFKGYGWYLSSTATLLYISYVLHNVVAWMKIRPFFLDPKGVVCKVSTGMWVARVYLGSLACTVPPIVLQIVDNFRYFNNLGDLYVKVRPYEPLMRDPWWVFTCLTLFHVIRKCYGTGVFELVKRSPRFGILLVAIVLAMVFTSLDIVVSIRNFIGTTDGINPFWKLSLVFKCLTDTIVLDDFKTELKRLGIKRMQADEVRRQSTALVLDDDKDEDQEVEFADALNATRSPPQGNALSPTASRSEKRLRQDSMDGRPQLGRGGKRIGRLPGLKSLGFESIKPGKNKKEKADADLEKQDTSEPMFSKEDDKSSSGSSTERVNRTRQASDPLDFMTTPAGY